MTGPLDESSLRGGLEGARIGRRIILLDQCDSTNSEAGRVVAREGRGCDGWVIFAERQTAGRGRAGRTWECPAGAGLLMSAIVSGPGEAGPRIVLAAGMALCRAVRQTTETEPHLRWPNDVYLGGRKLAGVLVETTATSGPEQMYVVGMGVNCLQQPAHFADELRERATSLEIESRQPVDRTAVAAAILRELDRLLPPGGAALDETLCGLWRELSGDAGRRIELRVGERTFQGTVCEIDPAAGLLVELDGGGRAAFDPFTAVRVR